MSGLDTDVLVVGGGPAGLAAAQGAAARGARVVLFEKSREIGYPIHTSGGSWVKELKALGIPDRFMHPIHVGRFIAPGAEAVFRYDIPKACVLDVRGLYQHLAERAINAGATIRLHSTVRAAIQREDSVVGVEVLHRGRSLRWQSRVVIDASGAHSVVASRVGLARPLRRYGIGAEYDLYAPRWPDHHVVFLFGSQVAPAGYAWLFSRGGHRLRAGVGMIRPETDDAPQRYLDELLARDDILEGSLSGASPIEYHVGTIPSQPPLLKTVHNGLLVVGDAGALISTLLGEGIRYSIDLGRLAGEVAADAVQRGDVSVRGLRSFERSWKRKYGRTFAMGWTLNQRLARYSDQDWNDKVTLLENLEPDLLPPLLRGEFTTGFLWRVSRHHPRLVGGEVVRRALKLWSGRGSKEREQFA